MKRLFHRLNPFARCTDKLNDGTPPRAALCGLANDRKNGFALIVVIWGLGLIALVAASISFGVRSHLAVVANSTAKARAVAAADAGVQIAILELLAARSVGRTGLPAGGQFLLCKFDADTTLQIMIQDEGGKVDLNAASVGLLKKLISAYVPSPQHAVKIAGAIADFRDSDDSPRPNGGEAAEYQAASMGHGPKQGPFQSISELEQVLGVRPELVRALAPHLTVHSQRAGIDPKVASPDLLRILSQRSHGRQQWTVGTPRRTSSGSASQRGAIPHAYVTLSTGHLVEITSQARVGARTTAVRRAVVEFSRSGGPRYFIRSWNEAGQHISTLKDGAGKLEANSNRKLEAC